MPLSTLVCTGDRSVCLPATSGNCSDFVICKKLGLSGLATTGAVIGPSRVLRVGLTSGATSLGVTS